MNSLYMLVGIVSWRTKDAGTEYARPEILDVREVNTGNGPDEKMIRLFDRVAGEEIATDDLPPTLYTRLCDCSDGVIAHAEVPIVLAFPKGSHKAQPCVLVSNQPVPVSQWLAWCYEG